MTHGATFASAVAGAPWEDAAALARLLEVTLSPESATITQAHSSALWKKLSYLGSNDLAYLLRGFAGVDYPEIVRDVCKHLRVREVQPGEEERVVEHNERLVLAKIFADAWEHLDRDERRAHLREMNLDESHLPLPGDAVAAAVLAGRAGPFAVYKLSRIVANSASRALPARRLAGARRKTAQAVALVASLRQAQRTALAETAVAEGPALAQASAVSPAEPSGARRSARKRAPKRSPVPARPEKNASQAQQKAPGRAKAAARKKKVPRKKTARGKKTTRKATGRKRSRPVAS
ncbi:MAG TPA: hypothetical protein VFS67_10840 [Polyangiaceae bacterium]|nr:hypothetical protein [Polyangiaceae bacterium]